MCMSWLSYIFPRTIARLSSPFNRSIRINEENGKYKLLANGARESGAYIEGLWQFAFERLQFPGNRKMRRILVLGTAGGTVIHMLHALFPQARITGVDIDEVMISVGKKYFALDKVPGLRLVCEDAVKFVKQYTGSRFDLIITDIFVGPDVPDFVTSPDYQRRVKKLLSGNGLTMINYLRQPGYEKRALALYDVLNSIYSYVVFADTHNNRFFLANSL